MRLPLSEAGDLPSWVQAFSSKGAAPPNATEPEPPSPSRSPLESLPNSLLGVRSRSTTPVGGSLTLRAPEWEEERRVRLHTGLGIEATESRGNEGRHFILQTRSRGETETSGAWIKLPAERAVVKDTQFRPPSMVTLKEAERMRREKMLSAQLEVEEYESGAVRRGGEPRMDGALGNKAYRYPSQPFPKRASTAVRPPPSRLRHLTPYAHVKAKLENRKFLEDLIGDLEPPDPYAPPFELGRRRQNEHLKDWCPPR